MNIVVLDTERPRREEIVKILQGLGHKVFEHGGVGWIGEAPNKVDACFFHVGDSGNWSKVEGIPGIRERLFWYSGHGLKFVPNPPGVGKPIPREIMAGLQMDPSLFGELLSSSVEFVGDEEPVPVGEGNVVKGVIERLLPPEAVVPAAPAVHESSPPTDSPSVKNERPVQGAAGGVPRLLQDEPPSVIVALSILCEGFLIATEEGREKTRKLPKGTAEKVQTKEWWRRPFVPVVGNLEGLARKEWGTSEPDQSVLVLVGWISGLAEKPGEDLCTLVPKVRKALEKNLG